MTSRIKAMWLFAKCGGLARPLPDGFWTEDDKDRLTAFLRSNTGAKLRHYTISKISEMNERAALSADVYKCGWATGMKAFWAIFQTLSASDAVSSETSSTDSSDDPLAHLRP